MTNKFVGAFEGLEASVAAVTFVGVVAKLVALQLRHERKRLAADTAVERFRRRKLPEQSNKAKLFLQMSQTINCLKLTKEKILKFL